MATLPGVDTPVGSALCFGLYLHWSTLGMTPDVASGKECDLFRVQDKHFSILKQKPLNWLSQPLPFQNSSDKKNPSKDVLNLRDFYIILFFQSAAFTALPILPYNRESSICHASAKNP